MGFRETSQYSGQLTFANLPHVDPSDGDILSETFALQYIWLKASNQNSNHLKTGILRKKRSGFLQHENASELYEACIWRTYEENGKLMHCSHVPVHMIQKPFNIFETLSDTNQFITSCLS